MRAAQHKGAHLAAWSMFGSIGLFAFVWFALVSAIAWATRPQPGAHLHLHPSHFQGPVLVLFAGAILVVAASLVVLGLATWWLRSDAETAPGTPAPAGHESV